MPKTKLEIINETVEYYSADPSGRRAATSEDGCSISTPDGHVCAYGRCMLPKVQKRFVNMCGPSLSEGEHDDSLMQEEYRGQDSLFWLELQYLHDNNNNWTPAGLSPAGRVYVNNLKEKYADNNTPS